MELAEWVKTARKFAKLTQEQLGELLSLTKSNISAWENARHEPSFGQLRTIAAITGYPLLETEGDHHRERQDGIESGPIGLDDNDEFPSIRLVRFKLAAGVSGFAIEYLNEDAAPIVFRRSWYRSRNLDPEKLYAVRVAGASMEPGLWEGDVVVVDTADTNPADGRVFAVNYEGELVVKRMSRDAGEWWLQSDNPDRTRYPRKACHDAVQVVGAIVHKQSERI